MLSDAMIRSMIDSVLSRGKKSSFMLEITDWLFLLMKFLKCGEWYSIWLGSILWRILSSLSRWYFLQNLIK